MAKHKLVESQVAALLGKGIPQKDIATLTNVSPRTVSRMASTLEPDLKAVDDLLARAQTRIRDVMPVEQRIDRLVGLLQVAEDTKQPSAGVSVLARLDAIDGLITDADRLKYSPDRDTPQAGPMFVLPSGSSISVTVTTTGSGLPSIEDDNAHTIDVSPIESTTE